MYSSQTPQKHTRWLRSFLYTISMYVYTSTLYMIYNICKWYTIYYIEKIYIYMYIYIYYINMCVCTVNELKQSYTCMCMCVCDCVCRMCGAWAGINSYFLQVLKYLLVRKPDFEDCVARFCLPMPWLNYSPQVSLPLMLGLHLHQVKFNDVLLAWNRAGWAKERARSGSTLLFSRERYPVFLEIPLSSCVWMPYEQTFAIKGNSPPRSRCVTGNSVKGNVDQVLLKMLCDRRRAFQLYGGRWLTCIMPVDWQQPQM